MKTFPVALDDETHKHLRHAAIDEGVSLHEWILDAIRRKLYHQSNRSRGNVYVKEGSEPYEADGTEAQD